MRLSTLLLICGCICICTGLADRTLGRLRIGKGHALAFCLLVLALSGISFPLAADATAGVSASLLVFAFLSLSGFRADTLLALLLALLCGMLDFALYRLAAGLPEPGLVLALPQALCARLLLNRRTGMLCAVSAPLAFGLVAAVGDIALMGHAALSLGGRLQLDAQTAGMLFTALLWYIPVPRAAHARTAVKNRS